jgi:hypothetical protein
VLIFALAIAAPAGLAKGDDKGPKPPKDEQGPPPVTTPPVTTGPGTTPPTTTTPPVTTTPPETTPPTAPATQPPAVSNQAPVPPPAAGSPPPAANDQPSRGGPQPRRTVRPQPRTVQRQPRSSAQGADRRPEPGTGARPARERSRRAAAPGLRHGSVAVRGGHSVSRSAAARRARAAAARVRNAAVAAARRARARAADRPAHGEAGGRRPAEADAPRRANRPSVERLLEQLPGQMAEAESRASTPRATVAVPREGLSQVVILLMTAAAGLVLLVALRLAGVATRGGPPADDFTAPPIPTPLSTGPLIKVGTLDLRRTRENRMADSARRAASRREAPGTERSAGDG